MSGIIDCEMRIGDEVFVHGYIDEIRNDTIIIRNVGGYFGTSRDEVFYYEDDGYGTMNEADRKTENSSEIPNNCEDEQTEETCERCVYVRGSQWCQGCNGTPKRWDGEKIVDTPQTEICDTCKYRSSNVFGNWCVGRDTCDRYEADTPQTDCETCKYGQDKHRYAHICNECGVGINNYTPQTETQTETQNSNLTFEKRTMRDCYNCKRYETEGECIECHYEPKDEPQDEYAKEYEELGLRKLKELRKDEPQTNADQHVQHVGSVEPMQTEREGE